MTLWVSLVSSISNYQWYKNKTPILAIEQTPEWTKTKWDLFISNKNAFLSKMAFYFENWKKCTGRSNQKLMYCLRNDVCYPLIIAILWSLLYFAIKTGLIYGIMCLSNAITSKSFKRSSIWVYKATFCGEKLVVVIWWVAGEYIVLQPEII